MRNTDLLDLLSYGQEIDIYSYYGDMFKDTQTRDKYINEACTKRELLDAYLQENGIIGYTQRIYDLCEILLTSTESEVQNG